ncbi:proteasome inhibitor PI31 subunit-like [Lycorma delicatula]|uniref:proteasome inhibitor PI31 subunit-like n=1 Tax=Lycorma delicatula TaxID=130591 RepID=UPI003F514D9E
MASTDRNLKFWELVYKTVEKDLKKEEDVLVAFIHLVLINNNYRSIGLGDSKDIIGNEKASELLPENWNADSSCYALRYLNGDKLYLLKVIPSGDNVIVTLINVQDLSVNSVAFNVTSAVKSIRGDTLADIIPNCNEIAKKIQCELIKSVKEATTQSCQAQERRTQPIIPPNIPDRGRLGQPRHPDLAGPPDWQARFDPFDYGRADLDPLRRGTGGMIFDPMGPQHPGIQPGLGIPGQLPRGAVPPGARFDPMGPPDFERLPRPRFPPDSDDMPPPGFEDMFM